MARLTACPSALEVLTQLGLYVLSTSPRIIRVGDPLQHVGGPRPTVVKCVCVPSVGFGQPPLRDAFDASDGREDKAADNLRKEALCVYPAGQLREVGCVYKGPQRHGSSRSCGAPSTDQWANLSKAFTDLALLDLQILSVRRLEPCRKIELVESVDGFLYQRDQRKIQSRSASVRVARGDTRRRCRRNPQGGGDNGNNGASEARTQDGDNGNNGALTEEASVCEKPYISGKITYVWTVR